MTRKILLMTIEEIILPGINNSNFASHLFILTQNATERNVIKQVNEKWGSKPTPNASQLKFTRNRFSHQL